MLKTFQDHLDEYPTPFHVIGSCKYREVHYFYVSY